MRSAEPHRSLRQVKGRRPPKYGVPVDLLLMYRKTPRKDRICLVYTETLVPEGKEPRVFHVIPLARRPLFKPNHFPLRPKGNLPHLELAIGEYRENARAPERPVALGKLVR